MSSSEAPSPASPVQRIRFSAARNPAATRAFVALRPVRHRARIGREERGVPSPPRSKTLLAQQFGEAAPGALLHDVRQQAEVLVAGTSTACRARTAACACRAITPRGFGVAERRLRPASRAASRPPSSRAGRTGCGRGAARRAPAAARSGSRARTSPSSADGSGNASSTAAQVNCLVIEHMRNSVRGRERDAPLGVGPAPGVARQDLARAEHGNRAAWSSVGARQRCDGAIEAA